MADMRNGVGRFRAQLQVVIEENGRQVLAAAEMRRANEQLGAEVGRLKQRVEVLEQHNQRLSAANEVMKQDVAAPVAEGSTEMKQNLTNLERELAKLKEEMKGIGPKAEPLALPAADMTVPPASKPAALAEKSSSHSLPSNVVPRPAKPAPMKMSPPPAPAETGKTVSAICEESEGTECFVLAE
jgi:regulator of replication initiation timing